MEFKDYYETLGVARDATPDEIKRSYRRLARKFHPDLSADADADDRFKEVQEAYEVLKDPEKRAAYDRFGADWQAGQEFRPPPDWQPDVGFSGGGYTEAGEFSDFFEALFGGAGRRRSGAGRRRSGGGYTHLRMKGEDIHARIAISVEDSFRGATRSLSLQVPQVDGEGRLVTRRRSLNVSIPRGVSEGQQIRLRGQGGPGLGGAPDGDLYLEVVFAPHPLFHAAGRDIHLDLPVAPWEAALGATVTAPTLGGDVELKIPAGAGSGSRLRLKGRGLPGTPAGDQYVEIEIQTLKADTDAARVLYERMRREMAFDPRAGLGKD